MTSAIQAAAVLRTTKKIHTGFLTAEALFASAGGNIDIALYDSNFQLVSNGVVNAAGERVDFVATAGTSYFLRVTGTNSDIDFRLTNLVSQSGSTVNVTGTAADDTLTFIAGSTKRRVSINGATYDFNKADVATINLEGGAGNDTITMTGSSGNDAATLRTAMFGSPAAATTWPSLRALKT